MLRRMLPFFVGVFCWLAAPTLYLSGQTVASPAISAQLAPSVTWPATGLTLTYTAGTVFNGGTSNAIAAGTLTMITNKTSCAAPAYSGCNFVYWASGTALSTTTTYATAAASGNRILYLVTTSAGGNITGATYASQDPQGLIPATYSDGAIFVSPSACWMTATTTAFTSGPALVRTAAGNQVLSATTNTTAGTVAVNCDVSFAGRKTSGLGFVATDVSLLYGVQTTALSSIAAGTVNSITYPAAGGAASGTVAALGGTLTVTPATLQLATTTAGNCYNENVAFGTTFSATDNQRVSVDQVFTTAGTTATTLQICGAIVHGNWVE